MSMVVRTNTMAINANSALNKNNSTVAGNLAKLSSGFRINRAADDASGLAVSEKMKAQIKALDQANKNAQDGASLIKTAEGYMGEIHDMLNRIVELAEKSANGTYETGKEAGYDTVATETYEHAGTDRQAIQDEVDQLTTEIDRIAKTANFNQLKLLDGSLTEKTETGATTYNVEGLFTLKDGAYSAVTSNTSDTKAGFYQKGTFSGMSDAADLIDAFGDDLAVDAEKEFFKADGTSVTIVCTNATEDSEAFKVKGESSAFTAYNTISTTNPYTAVQDSYWEQDGKTIAGETTTTGASLKLQIGETSEAADKLEVSIMSFKTADLFSAVADKVANTSAAAKTGGFVADPDVEGSYQGFTLNVSNQDAASRVAESVRDVINKVSSQRATLGAMENRLDYTMNNLDTASQNITDANSRIRDTDMAKTMMEYTQGNTLTQAAQAMLAQANQAPSQVLQLLQ